MNFKFHFLNVHITASITRINGAIQRFYDLTPVDNADPNGNYTEALNYAMSSDRIKNIAITGPYGAGKSSIIKTYEKRSAFKFLNISLASFKDKPDESDNQDQNILIERSILQQMLYGSDANKLPYSRFKRITTPVSPLLKSFIAVLWCINSLFLYSNDFFQHTLPPSGISFSFFVLLVAFFVSIPIVIFSDIYKATFLISFKKISLSNAEFETGDISEDSILNRHLDEIIYFFQSTNYDAVVIEDLDRFQSPEIFVKLREINKLINDSEIKKGNIKFLYALKDNMFEHKDRAKFFDFIIPVVPIINSSNSLDKMRERIQANGSSWNVCPQFLREVSWYVDDLRLIHNIFNEFSIYHEILNSQNLNSTKLLAIIIYKNLYPEDFELLHHGDGALFSISKKRIELIEIARKSITKEILSAKSEIKKSDAEYLQHIDEIVKVFVGHLVTTSGVSNIISIDSNKGELKLTELKTWEDLEPLMNQKNLTVNSYQGYYNQHASISLGKSFATMESEISPSFSFIDRRKDIEKKEATKRAELEKSIIKLEKDISSLSQLPLNQLLLSNDEPIESVISEFQLKDSGLFMYLVRNGYIDETYHLYTSYFHEGRMTKNDRDFLLAIRDFKKPNPTQTIDTAGEVFANMRPEDFSHKYVLNVNLMDYLLSEPKKNYAEINSAINYISDNFFETEDFFSAYWQIGRQVKEFTLTLTEKWPGYAVSALKTTNPSRHLTFLLNHVSSDKVIDALNIDETITRYLSDFGASVFCSEDFGMTDHKPLKSLKIKVKDVLSIEDNKSLVDYVYKNELYQINVANVIFLMEKFLEEGVQSLKESRNYSTLSLPGCELLKNYIDNNIQCYILNVFLMLPKNSEETSESIHFLLNNEKIDESLKKEIISKQSFIFSSLKGVPDNLWEHVISEDRIKPSWSIILAYLERDEANHGLLTEKIQTESWFRILINSPISKISASEQQKKRLASFIFMNDDIDLHIYTELTKNLPYFYYDFPDVSDEKKTSLAENRVVRLTEKSFNTSDSDDSLKAKLIERNADIYFDSIENYSLNPTLKGLLLQGSLTGEQKFEICQRIQLEEINFSKELATLAADFIAFNNIDWTKIDDEIMYQLVIHDGSVNTSIQLLCKCVHTWNEERFMTAISHLPEPYRDIALYGKRPKLQNTKLNEKFSETIKLIGFISSIKYIEDMIQINTFKSTDHSDE